MPVTRKSTRSRGGAAAAAAQGKQQTLSFHHRVTKPTVKTGKDLVKEEEEETPETVTKTKTKDDIKVKDDVTEVPEAESHSEEEEEEEHEKKKKKKKQQPHAKVKKPANKAATKHVKEEPKQQEKKEHEPKRSEIELCALEIPQSAIDAYWNKIDSARMASTVHKKHTQDLTTGEKVLRYFDVSSHYGPCIGITRLKRWQRAEKLGLNPPLEVLAVLLKEGEGENKASERAHMDELMNSVSTGP